MYDFHFSQFFKVIKITSQNATSKRNNNVCYLLLLFFPCFLTFLWSNCQNYVRFVSHSVINLLDNRKWEKTRKEKEKDRLRERAFPQRKMAIKFFFFRIIIFWWFFEQRWIATKSCKKTICHLSFFLFFVGGLKKHLWIGRESEWVIIERVFKTLKIVFVLQFCARANTWKKFFLRVRLLAYANHHHSCKRRFFLQAPPTTTTATIQ